MRRILSVAVLLCIGALTLSPAKAVAHGGRWGCHSYYSGYTYYYPRYYYPSYNSCNYSYGNYYGNYYGNNYAPYPTYGYGSPYNNLGVNNLGLGGGNILGLLAGNGVLGANLSGSLLQPSYLSMPVSVGYGQTGFLQIPTGNAAGRATYLQIPVNTGYGPSSYLQIELGRSSGSTVPATPTPGATPTVPPFGAAPGTNAATAGQFSLNIHKTAADEIPPAVLPTDIGPARAATTVSIDVPAASNASLGDENVATDTNAAPSMFQFVSLSTPRETPRVTAAVASLSRAKETSFSLRSDEKPNADRPKPDSLNELVFERDQDPTPWVVK